MPALFSLRLYGDPAARLAKVGVPAHRVAATCADVALTLRGHDEISAGGSIDYMPFLEELACRPLPPGRARQRIVSYARDAAKVQAEEYAKQMVQRTPEQLRKKAVREDPQYDDRTVLGKMLKQSRESARRRAACQACGGTGRMPRMDVSTPGHPEITCVPCPYCV